MTLFDDIAKSVGGGVKYALTPFYKAGEAVGQAAYASGRSTGAAIQAQLLPRLTPQQAPPKPAAPPSPSRTPSLLTPFEEAGASVFGRVLASAPVGFRPQVTVTPSPAGLPSATALKAAGIPGALGPVITLSKKAQDVISQAPIYVRYGNYAELIEKKPGGGWITTAADKAMLHDQMINTDIMHPKQWQEAQAWAVLQATVLDHQKAVADYEAYRMVHQQRTTPDPKTYPMLTRIEKTRRVALAAEEYTNDLMAALEGGGVFLEPSTEQAIEYGVTGEGALQILTSAGRAPRPLPSASDLILTGIEARARVAPGAKEPKEPPPGPATAASIFGFLPSFGAQARETGPTETGPAKESKPSGLPQQSQQQIMEMPQTKMVTDRSEPPAGWIAGIPLLGDVYRAGQRFAAGRTQTEMAERYKSPLGDFLLSRPSSQYLLGVLPKKPGTFIAGLPGAAAETWAAGDVVLSDILYGMGAPKYQPTGTPMDIPGGMYSFVVEHPGTAAELPLLGELIGPVVGAAAKVSPLLGKAVQWGGLGLMGYSTFEKGKEIVEAPPEEQYMKLGGALAEYGLLFGPSAGRYIYEKAPIRPGFETYEMPSGAKATILGIQSRRGTPVPEMYPLGYRVVEEIPLEEALLPTKPGLVGRLRGAVGKIGVGTPEMSLRSIMGKDIFLEAQIRGEIPHITVEGTGPGATRILERAVAGMEGSAEEIGKWTLGREIRAITSRAGVSPGAMRPQIVAIVTEHKLPNPEKVADAIIRVMKADMAKGEAGYMYGSPIQRAAGATVGEPGLPRVGKDIDYMAIAEKEFQKEMVGAVNEAAGGTVVTAKGGKILDPAGRTLFDVHEAKAAAEIGMGVSGVSPAPIKSKYMGLGIQAEPKVLTEEGLRSMAPSEQTSAKLLGSTFTVSEQPRTLETPTARVTGRIMGVYEGRLKDIGDYYFAERTNIKALDLQGRTGGAAKASAKLEKWLDLWGPDNAAYVRNTYAMQTTGGGVQFPTLVTGEEALTAGASQAANAFTRAAYPTMMEPALGAARLIRPPGPPVPTARVPSPVDDATRAIFYGGEESMGAAARRGTAGILEQPSPVDLTMREAASLSAFSGVAMERPSPTLGGFVPARPRVEPSPAPYRQAEEDISSASAGIFGYPAPREVVSPPSRIPSPEKPYSPRIPSPDRPYPRIPSPDRPYPRIPSPDRPYPRIPSPDRPYTPPPPVPVVTTLIIQAPEEQKRQKKKEEDEQLRWRRRGAHKAVHVYSEIAPGATAEEVMAMIFGGTEPQQGRVKVQAQAVQAKVQARAPVKPSDRGNQKARTVEEEAQRISDQEMRRIWGGRG